MTKKVKKTKKNGIADENSVDEKVEVVAEESESMDGENLGTPSYEELLDKKEDLEQALIRANADLDNSSIACSISFLSATAAPTPLLKTIFRSFGTCIILL